MAIEVTSKKVYSDKDPSSGERDAGVVYASGGQLRERDLVDKRIEDKALRMTLEKDEGYISITVLPGEKLGQLSVNVQFEGKSGEPEFCLKEQDTLLQHAADWLNELLSGFGCDFKAQIESLPCPHAEARLQIDLAARKLSKVVREVKVDQHVSAPPREIVRETSRRSKE